MESKRRISKYILPIILQHRTSIEQYYVEPFCGGCNLIDKVEGNRIASDLNFYLMEMWKAVSNGWIPEPNYTENDYKEVKENKDINPVLTGYFGFALSYGGKWFGGWCRDREGKEIM